LWTLSAEGGVGRLFSNALPIADGDHALHHATCHSCADSRVMSNISRCISIFHSFEVLMLFQSQVMEEIPKAFPMWPEFKDTLSGVARAFGSFHRLDRFRDVCIQKNPSVPQARLLVKGLCLQ